MTDALATPMGEMAEEPERGEIGRRDFFNVIAAGAFGIAGFGALVVTYRYLLPNALFEPSMNFRAGTPDLYPIDSVTYMPDEQVYIVRIAAGFYAVSSICTHLGCNTQWKPEVNLIACPCHGSKFKRDGTKVEGPAPRSLPHFAITLTPDGELLVDKLEVIKAEQALRV